MSRTTIFDSSERDYLTKMAAARAYGEDESLTFEERTLYMGGTEIRDITEEIKTFYYKYLTPHNHITRDIKPKGQCPGCDISIYQR